MRNLTGMRFGDYSLVEPIGSGGMGAVYLAEDRSRNRRVAMKVMDLGDRDPERRRRFVLEVKSLCKLRHPDIVRIHDGGGQGEFCWYVMDLLEGEELHRILRRCFDEQKSFLPMERVFPVALSVARALAYCHAQDVLHRDVKPQNVFVRPDGTAVLVDFGLARLENESAVTREGTVVGTMLYMAPEQIKDEAVGPHTDVYQFGLLLYAMLTGKVPFQGENVHTTLVQRISRNPPPPSLANPTVWPWVERLVLRCLAIDPAERPPSMGPVAQVLESRAERLDEEGADAVRRDPGDWTRGDEDDDPARRDTVSLDRRALPPPPETRTRPMDRDALPPAPAPSAEAEGAPLSGEDARSRPPGEGPSAGGRAGERPAGNRGSGEDASREGAGPPRKLAKAVGPIVGLLALGGIVGMAALFSVRPGVRPRPTAPATATVAPTPVGTRSPVGTPDPTPTASPPALPQPPPADWKDGRRFADDGGKAVESPVPVPVGRAGDGIVLALSAGCPPGHRVTGCTLDLDYGGASRSMSWALAAHVMHPPMGGAGTGLPPHAPDRLYPAQASFDPSTGRGRIRWNLLARVGEERLGRRGPLGLLLAVSDDDERSWLLRARAELRCAVSWTFAPR